MADERTSRGRDLVLPPNTYAWVLDQANGDVKVITGFKKVTLEPTDQPVRLDPSTKRFVPCTVDEAICLNITASQKYYIELRNPVSGDGKPHPAPTSNNGSVKLDIGKKVNIPGPIDFPLYPGQIAKVVRGHNLLSNQYILAQVYDAEEAEHNWSKAIIQPATTDVSATPTIPIDGTPNDNPPNSGLTKSKKTRKFAMGELMVIEGTDTSFFIPPTGIRVVPEIDKEENETYVRDAVTLERLEYCVLLDENGQKRYVRGPAVVFPKATEKFMSSKSGFKKFKAVELNLISGIHGKTIAPFTDESGKKHEVGEELFITGKEQPVFYPREELAIIKYGDQSKVYAVAIPEGESRYVLNRLTGVIRVIKGPTMFLPDPRNEVVIRRILSSETCELYYPGNAKALSVNQALEMSQAFAAPSTPGVAAKRSMFGGVNISNKGLTKGGGDRGISEIMSYNCADLSTSSLAGQFNETFDASIDSDDSLVGDEFSRGTIYTPPRTMVLDTKYDGAVVVRPWNNYAVMITDGKGTRKVVLGPTAVTLEYDETLERLALSGGTPKTDAKLVGTVYLQVENNRVSDAVSVETKDLVRLNLRLSYRLNFISEKDEDRVKWFAVTDYTGFLADHLRSKIRNAVKKIGIQEFYNDAINIIRNIILGESKEGHRTGLKFAENNMLVYDVEVLAVDITDGKINEQLTSQQRAVFTENMKLEDMRRLDAFNKESNTLAVSKAIDNDVTGAKLQELSLKEIERQKVLVAAESEHHKQSQAAAEELAKMKDEAESARATARRLRAKHDADQSIELTDKKFVQMRVNAEAETNAVVKKAEAVSKAIAPALIINAQMEHETRVAEAIGAIAVIKDVSIQHILEQLMNGMGSSIGELTTKLGKLGGYHEDGDNS